VSTELPWLPFLLQTSDALFPTGAYAHSLGFEEAVRLGIVRDEATLREFLIEHVVPAQAGLELPWLRFAFDAAMAGDLAELRRGDREIEAWKLAAESREASVQLGVRRLRAFDTIVARGGCRGHHLTVCGLQAAIERVPLEAALAAAYYQALAAICAAAMKLIRIGQDGCQRVLRAAAGLAEETIAFSRNVARTDAGTFNPLLEIASLRHARAEERLFIS
jgi:urease accessory protein